MSLWSAIWLRIRERSRFRTGVKCKPACNGQSEFRISPVLVFVWVLTDSVFFSRCFRRKKIAYLKAPERNISLQELLTDVMRRKLLRRARRQKGDLSAKDLENVETRASSAYRELQEAWHFQYVIPNHDGEDSDNWEAFYYLIGDARKTFEAFVGLLKGHIQPNVENWEEDLLPSKI
jgi:hypothetical protein